MFHTNGGIYISTTQDGYAACELLLKRNKHISLIVTSKPSQKESISDYADFELLAKRYSVPLLKTNNLKKHVHALRAVKPHLIIVNGWSQLLPKEIIDIPIHGTVGTHPALLPKNRGRAPIAWHFINQETHGGISLFYLDQNCDSGPIIKQIKFKISPSDNARSYYDRITKEGANLLLTYFDALLKARLPAKKQNGKRATYLLRRFPEDSRIDFTQEPPAIINLIRAVTDIYPLAFFFYKGKKYYCLKANRPLSAPRFSGKPGQIAFAQNNALSVISGKKSKLVLFTNIIDAYKKPISIVDTFAQGYYLNSYE